MNYNQRIIHNNGFRFILIFTITFLTLIFNHKNSYSQTCPTLVDSDYVPITSTLGYKTSYENPNLDTSNIDPNLVAIGSSECKDLPNTIAAQPGYNCFYDGKPLCNSTNSTSYVIPTSNIFAGGGIPRFDCHDLIDLPLCDILTKNSIVTEPGKNCVTRCSQIPLSTTLTDVRGQDYAVHNRDCIRLCDEVNDELVIDPNLPSSAQAQCSARLCHQLGWTSDNNQPIDPVTGANGNCNRISCVNLYPIELIDVGEKLQDDASDGRVSGNYCDKSQDANGNLLKCYDFSIPQLRYTVRDKMCSIHKCQPDCSTFESQIDENGDGVIDNLDHDDTLNITLKETNSANIKYQDVYQLHQYACYDVTTDALCQPVICLPVVNRQYRCTNAEGNITGTSEDTTPNPNCGSSAAESNCEDDNFCEKIIDCNLSSNSNEPECQVSSDESEAGTLDDSQTLSWFYRPKPLNKDMLISRQGDVNIIDPELHEKLCYPQSVFESRASQGWEPAGQSKWGWDGKIKIDLGFTSFTIPLGYFHSYIAPDATRAGGICHLAPNDQERENVGFRGTGYPYLCYREYDGDLAITGGIYQHISSHTGYYEGYSKTEFQKNNATHKVRVCLRFRNFLRPDDGYSETCGKRECGVTCLGFAGGCSSQNCGYDRCYTLEVEDNKPHECALTSKLFEASFGALVIEEGFEDSIDNMENSEGEEYFEDETDDQIDNVETYLFGHEAKCLKVVDDFLRIRIQKYGTNICAFLDAKGQTAYPDNAVQNPIKFSDGSEIVLDDGFNQYCLDGTVKQDGSPCSAFNSKSEPGSAEKWRTLKITPSVNIPYIQNNQPDSANFRGYIDRNGRVHLEQNCIKVALRKAPLDFYNIANATNSPKLFVPPVYIANARKYKNGAIAQPQNAEESYGVTSFHYPEIEVRFGGTSMLLSLEEDDIGDEEQSVTIDTTVNEIPYSEELFTTKEYDIGSDQPIYCLYQRVFASDGTYKAPYRIGCVYRQKPEMDNSTSRISDPNLKAQLLFIESDPANTYDSSSITFKYLSDFGANDSNDNCSNDDKCTQSLSITNPNVSSPNCASDIENYEVCAIREECSQLNNECMKNEIDIQNAKINGQSTLELENYRDWCNSHLITLCNNKKGMASDPNANIYNSNPSGASPDDKAYGWFNELCLNKGPNTTSFNHTLQQVIAYNPNIINNKVKGKCIIDEINSPYMTDSDPNTNCDDGGKAPNCLCVKYVEGVEINADHTVRNQTPREAGLCIDMPLPETCPAISYNSTPNVDSNDPDYVSWSLNVNSQIYGTTQGNEVHISHELRSNGEGHAEFPVAMMGMNQVEGYCKGFWKNSTTASGIKIPPTRSCNNDAGTAIWDSTVQNHCDRYSCPQISTNGINQSGVYQGGYGSNENPQEMGLSHGYALWPYHKQSSDFAENVTANSCIIGYKEFGSNPVDQNNDTIVTNYANGSLPNRDCNQLGEWQATNQDCQRIKCSPVNVPTNYGGSYQQISPSNYYQSTPGSYQLIQPENYYIETVTDSGGNNVEPNFDYSPSNPNPTPQLDNYSYTGRYDKDANGIITNVQWDYWVKSGGAMFLEETLSSRSSSFIESSSKTTGYCNNELGFFQAGNQSPTLECDHLGNWVVKNKCVTRCDIIPAGIESEDENNGYASWPKTDVALVDTANIENNKEQVSGSCLDSSQSSNQQNLLPYPYPPLRQRDGENYKILYSDPEYLAFLNSSQVSLEQHLDINQFSNDPNETNLIPVDVKNDTRFHFNDALDNVEKWSIPSENLQNIATGSTQTSNYPQPTRLCKWVRMDTGFTTNYWHPADSKCVNTCPSGNYDPRLNVGITEHNIYNANNANNAEKFYINWPETNLGTWVFVTSHGVSQDSAPSSLNASHFSNDLANGRINGHYIVARRCGLDGKWEDPKPQCATNGGEIFGSHASYDTETIANSGTIEAGSGDIASATYCTPQPTYYPKGQENHSQPLPNTGISQYSCEYHDNTNKNIDQVYFQYQNGDPCEVFCNAPDGTEFGNAKNKAGNKYVKKGSYLQLSCKSGFGHDIFSNSTSDSTCGRTATDRTSTPPSIQCSTTNDGAWVSGVTHDCDACRSCNANSGHDYRSYKTEGRDASIQSGSTTISFKWGDNTCDRSDKTCSINSCIDGCNNNSHFSASHGDRRTIKKTDKSTCKKSCKSGLGQCTRDSNMDSKMSLQCVDGRWMGISGDQGNTITCN